MSYQTAISGVFFVVSMGCMLRANLLFQEIVVEINRLLPQQRAILFFGFMRHRFFEVVEEYKRLYPDGTLVVKLKIWSAIGFVCLFGSAAFLFFSGSASTGYIPTKTFTEHREK